MDLLVFRTMMQGKGSRFFLITNTQFLNNKAVVTYEFSEEDLKVLRHLKEHGYMEFRFPNSGSDIVDNLLDFGFVKTNDDSWHFTVELSELGKSVVASMDMDECNPSLT